MPFWTIHHPEPAFTEETKREIANRITEHYGKFLPRFYVNVLFQPFAAGSLFIGGEAADDFVRVTVDHIARRIPDPEAQGRFMDKAADILRPYVADRGFRWEMHVDETPFGLWSVDGIKPPGPGTPAEAKWRDENAPSPFPQET